MRGIPHPVTLAGVAYPTLAAAARAAGITPQGLVCRLRRARGLCTQCGGAGDRGSLCARHADESLADHAAKYHARVPRSRRVAHTCGICGAAGHNRRTCPGAAS